MRTQIALPSPNPSKNFRVRKKSQTNRKSTAKAAASELDVLEQRVVDLGDRLDSSSKQHTDEVRNILDILNNFGVDSHLADRVQLDDITRSLSSLNNSVSSLARTASSQYTVAEKTLQDIAVGFSGLSGQLQDFAGVNNQPVDAITSLQAENGELQSRALNGPPIPSLPSSLPVSPTSQSIHGHNPSSFSSLSADTGAYYHAVSIIRPHHRSAKSPESLGLNDSLTTVLLLLPIVKSS
ncbi:hypothetical protein D9758_012722 [Tetrapyrgos nigripes]|uniref:Uncharacterized protein n=1 Tax=Tetrapyrgos nigripes TaxID=182062 RepID=A0A8H5CWU3_9AGAR|nr:hypothetical protein D9758_012722 [Tetrapyrgos nigripes]